MNRFRIVSIIAALACLVAGCASNQPAASTSQPSNSPAQVTASGAAMPAATQPLAATALPAQGEATTYAPASSPTAPEPTIAPSSSRDFTQIDVCSLVSDQEVAQLDNGTVQSPAQSSDLGTTRGCTYGIQTADGGYDSVIIYVEPPDLLEASLELSDNKGTPVAGLGDQAYLQEDTDASQFRLLAERQGDFGVEVIGENSDALVAIAKLVFTRIQ